MNEVDEGVKQIYISKSTWDKLMAIKEDHESFDDIIRKLIKETISGFN